MCVQRQNVGSPMLSRRRLLGSLSATGVALATERAVPAAADSRRLIVDSQIHLWAANTPERPWVRGAAPPQLPEPFTIERVVPMLDEAGVDRVVIVPPTLEGERLDYAQEAVKRYPARFAIMARIPLDKPQRAQSLSRLRDEVGVLGVRFNFVGRQAAWLTDGTADWFWPVAEKAGLPVMFLTAGQTPLFARIAERYPQLTLILDHMGVGASLRPRADSTGVVTNTLVPDAIAQTAALAKYPNVSVKLSSVPLISTEAYPFRDTIPHIRRLFDAYGPQRCHWGTDVTNSLARATYGQRVTQFTEELPFLTEEDKDWIMGRSIVARLRWA
jgi:predicted TIM-barrel fold metal-dependent hydrolase